MYYEPLDLNLYLEKEAGYIGRDCSTNNEICEIKLVKRTRVSPTAHLFVFGYPQEIKGAVEVGAFGHFLFSGHLLESATPGFWNAVKLENGEKEVKRKYTPIYIDAAKRQIHFLIRIYGPCEEFPDGGKFTRFLDKLEVQDSLKVIPWKPKYRLVEEAVIRVLGRRLEYKVLNLIAAGTGITPFVRLLTHYQNTPVSVNLIYCNRSIEEIMLKELFDTLTCSNSNIRVRYLVYSRKDYSESGSIADSPSISRCIINKEIISEVLEVAEKSVTLYCGPPKFCDLVKELLASLNFTNSHVI
ncbi:NADH-cytochrome B5 reductase, putative [Theileria equi strain WA]|uniref:NADH-cytochrome B5 reductase, putative n=1 Tax=Theileria equi strain WA TaxID=1537102 RepID=L0AVB5_THEEQ|nr:NADH-cytochrome B5 reductase, putative [Theileria equi strain WA]AFZ79480.1 NADH-cytochrome B5 reductase, putative [Theileria equi strain WA]|eukprot:XP_004829146.1 NADH-cytochrome B5 reductase, putative [Theileria equi strain WA]